MKLNAKRWFRVMSVLTAAIGLGYLLWRVVLSEVTNEYYAVGVLLVIFSITILLWKLPQWQIASWKNNVDSTQKIELKDYIKAETDARASLAQMIGGLFVLMGLYFTAANLKNSQQTLELSRQGQITERFTKAVQEIASKDQPDIVIGGLYALGRIAKESAPDHWPIMEVITAYVRRAAPSTNKDCDPTERIQFILDQPPQPTVQTVMNILKERLWQNEVGADQMLNLQFTDLTRVNLRGANLKSALFDSAVLKGATIDGKATVEQASFKYSVLSFATFEGSNLREAELTNTCLVQTSFRNADLTNANFTNATNLRETDFSGAILTHADFSGVDLSRAKGLSREQLRDAIVDNAKLPSHLEVSN